MNRSHINAFYMQPMLSASFLCCRWAHRIPLCVADGDIVYIFMLPICTSDTLNTCMIQITKSYTYTATGTLSQDLVLMQPINLSYTICMSPIFTSETFLCLRLPVVYIFYIPIVQSETHIVWVQVPLYSISACIL